MQDVALGTDPDHFVLNLPDEAINQCQTVTVDYEAPTTNPIRGTDGNAGRGLHRLRGHQQLHGRVSQRLNDPVFGGDDPRMFSVEENVPLGTDIGEPVTATDADRDTLTYSVDTASPYASYFQIDSATGQLQTNVATGRVFSHENDPNTGYDIIVVADDGREGTDTAQIAVDGERHGRGRAAGCAGGGDGDGLRNHEPAGDVDGASERGAP